MIDAENLEFYLLGDINCDLLAESPDNSTKELLSISTTYNLSQIISQPTRITNFLLKGHENEKYGYRKCEYRFLRLLMQLKYLYFSTSFVFPYNKVSLEYRVEKLCKMLVEPVSDVVFAKIPQKCYQARKCTTVLATHNSIKQVF